MKSNFPNDLNSLITLQSILREYTTTQTQGKRDDDDSGRAEE